MPNRILDKKYLNRWVDIGDHTVKFENSRAEVSDEDIRFFENHPEFEIQERNPVKEVELKVEENKPLFEGIITPPEIIKKSRKKQK